MLETIKTIISDFHQWKLPSPITARNLKVPIDSDKIISIIGPRRTGKTWFLFDLIQTLRKETDPRSIIYINFEDERLDIKAADMHIIIDAYQQLYPDFELSGVYFFFDEIQEIQGWEKFIRRIYDTVSRRIFITGSSAKLMSSEISTSLRGRSLSYILLPFSFSEFLRHQKLSNYNIHSSKDKNLLASSFDIFLKRGGFPEIFNYDDTLFIKTMQSYVDIMLYRDIIERHEMKNTYLIKDMLKRIIASNARIFSINKYYNDLKSRGLSVAKNLLYELMNHFEDIYAVIPVAKYHESFIKRNRSMKKIYMNDTGIVTSYNFITIADHGWLLETFVLLEIIKKGFNVFYFANGFETDFIVEHNGRPVHVFQVCWNLNKNNINREIIGLRKALNRFNFDTGYIITSSRDEIINIDSYIIKVIPAWKWTLTFFEK